MNLERWTAVDHYLAGALLPADPALAATLQASEAAGLPPIAVSALQGRFLQLLAAMLGARRVLEVGTLGGYSSIWLARGMAPGGRLVTLELDPKHADVARQNLTRAGLADVVDVRQGPAIELLSRLADEGAEPFDLVFIDADKPGNPDYFAWAMKLTRAGSVIVVDNVVRDGEVIDAASTNPGVMGVRRLHEMIRSDARVIATALQTVGTKGWDGFTIVRVQSAGSAV